MAGRNTQLKEREQPASGSRVRNGRRETAQTARHTTPASAAKLAPELDAVIHERIRLGIVSALAVNDALSFTDLRKSLNTSDGNLSVHARRLENAGYLKCNKYFEERTPRTEFQLTTAGRRALEAYLLKMEELIRAVRK